jgi:hypothetical protein
MCFSHVNEHMSILYVSYIKFPTNRFVENFCPNWIGNNSVKFRKIIIKKIIEN